jgi:phenylglyoxylate dehydrogenase beta subunit
MAVETNIVPLWEYEDKIGKIRFTHKVDDPLPVERYLSMLGKYRHLNKKEIEHIQQLTDKRMELIKSLSIA